FPSGFMTRYEPSMIVGTNDHQHLATGFPLGMRFKSAKVTMASDGNVIHLGHHARADGRWRVYAFADRPGPTEPSALRDWAEWMGTADDSPLLRHTPPDEDPDSVLDVKVIYQQGYDEVDVTQVPAVFRPKWGPLGLVDWQQAFAARPTAWCDTDSCDERGLSRDGVVVEVRPDEYVAAILPLTAKEELAEFFSRSLLRQRGPAVPHAGSLGRRSGTG